MKAPPRAPARAPDIIAEIRVPAEVAPYMQRHGRRALAAVKGYADACSTLDEKLGALGVLAQILLAYGDSLQAHQLSKVSGTKN